MGSKMGRYLTVDEGVIAAMAAARQAAMASRRRSLDEDPEDLEDPSSEPEAVPTPVFTKDRTTSKPLTPGFEMAAPAMATKYVVSSSLGAGSLLRSPDDGGRDGVHTSARMLGVPALPPRRPELSLATVFRWTPSGLGLSFVSPLDELPGTSDVGQLKSSLFLDSLTVPIQHNQQHTDPTAHQAAAAAAAPAARLSVTPPAVAAAVMATAAGLASSHIASTSLTRTGGAATNPWTGGASRTFHDEGRAGGATAAGSGALSGWASSNASSLTPHPLSPTFDRALRALGKHARAARAPTTHAQAHASTLQYSCV